VTTSTVESRAAESTPAAETPVVEGGAN
jgi:hypothetical protein